MTDFISKEAYQDVQRRYLDCADMLYRIIADYNRSDMERLIEEAKKLVRDGYLTRKTGDITTANAQAAALRRALTEALMLLDTYSVPVPQSTRQALIVHGSADIAGQTFLDKLTAAEERIRDLERALDERHLIWSADQETIARLRAEIQQKPVG